MCGLNNRWDLLKDFDNADVDELLVVEQRQQGLPPETPQRRPPMPRMPPKMGQKMRHITHTIKDRKPISPQQIANIQEAIKNGTSGLPPLDAGEVWALVDSGSAPHVAPHALFPKFQIGHDAYQERRLRGCEWITDP